MDIAVIATSFPRFDGDSAGRFVLDLSRGLRDLGHRLVHVVPAAPGWPARETLDGLEVRRVRYLSPSGLQSLAYGRGIGANVSRMPLRAAQIPFLVRALRRGLEDAIGDLDSPMILSHWLAPCGTIAADVAARRRLAHVAVAHGGGVHLLRRLPGVRRRMRRLAEGTDHLVCVSADLLRKTRELGGEDLGIPATVCPMGIDPDRFAGDGRVEHDLGASWTVLGVGRLIGLKGFDLLVRAAGAAGDTAVVLVGEGPEERRLRAQAARWNVPVCFTGHLAPDVLGAWYRSVDALVVPSRRGARGRTEGCPVVVPEAFTAGLPVIASRTGGLTDVIEHGTNGLLFDANDAGELADMLRRLRDDADGRSAMAAAAKEDASRFEHRAVAGRLDEVFRAVQERRR